MKKSPDPFYLNTLAVIFMAAGLNAQPLHHGKEYNVAIFVPNGAELLDFTGPGEVFAAANGFNTYIISFSTEPITSQGFVKIQPNYAYTDCPKPDIIVIPGGGTGQFPKHPESISWIEEKAKDAVMLTVCTGATVAARAGLIDNMKVTTHYSAFDYLQKLCPSCEVLPDTRFVDNGHIITTAGISAGIDGALHLVSRIRGMEEARKVAEYMEYDKWEPEDGLVIYHNPYIEGLRKEGIAAVQALPVSMTEGNRPPFYPGELINLAAGLEKAGKNQEAIELLEYTTKRYPFEKAAFEQLSKCYQLAGRFAPPAQEAFVDMLLNGHLKEAMKIYREVQLQYPNWMLFEESALNWTGYSLMNQGKMEEAIEVFKLNADEYPTSFNVFDSLGEAYLKAGNKEEARKALRHSLELNPDNEHGRKLLEKL